METVSYGWKERRALTRFIEHRMRMYWLNYAEDFDLPMLDEISTYRRGVAKTSAGIFAR